MKEYKQELIEACRELLEEMRVVEAAELDWDDCFILYRQAKGKEAGFWADKLQKILQEVQP